MLKTTVNREDQVADFVASNAKKKGLEVWSIVRPHGLRGYIIIEALDHITADAAVKGIPYARKLIPKEVKIEEIEHLLELVEKEIEIKKGDIVEIISGPFKREQAKVIRVDKARNEVVVEFLAAMVPMPTALKIDAIRVIRREEKEEEKK